MIYVLCISWGPVSVLDQDRSPTEMSQFWTQLTQFWTQTCLNSGPLYKMPIMTINYIFAVVISQCKLRLIPKTTFAYVKH